MESSAQHGRKATAGMLLRDGQIIACRIHIVEDRSANQGKNILDSTSQESQDVSGGEDDGPSPLVGGAR